MTTSAGEFVKLVTAMTESVSRNEISASEAVTTLRRSLVDNFDFSVGATNLVLGESSE